MSTRSKKRRPASRPQAPKARSGPAGFLSQRRGVASVAFAAVALAIGIAVAFTQIGRDHGRSPSAGLPNTSDYHSLLVSPASGNELTLGTHQGLFRSGDGGKTWSPAGLASADAMNLGRASGATIWAAGHYLFAKSVDGGRSWENVSPPGLPSLDIHGFAVDPRHPATLYAAVAGEGLYRSSDGGRSFAPRSREVGGTVMALAVTPDGRILAGDMERGLLASSDGGRGWRPLVRAQIFGLALDPVDPKRILAAGPGVLLSTDAGARWRLVLQLDQGAGPVAWTRDGRGAYVVGFDRTLYRSDDQGASWRLVVGG